MNLIIGCGYLGQRVAQRWLDEGRRVAALTRSAERAAEFRNCGIEPIVGDVTRRETLAALAALPELSTVLYAVGFDRSAGLSQREVYVGGLDIVLAALGQRPARFMYISSTSVYGQSDGEWVDESSPREPDRENGRVCLEAEQHVRRHFATQATDGPRATILRLAGIYGPGRLLRRIEQVRSGEPLSGNPDAWLNLIHVDDAVTTVLACERRQPVGGTVLVCDDEPVRRRDYYTLLAKLLDAPPPTFAAEMSPGSEQEGLNKRCSNALLRGELRVELGFPTVREGLPHALFGDVSSRGERGAGTAPKGWPTP
jgi:nucleoside-diphosphate-sugar epimerase